MEAETVGQLGSGGEEVVASCEEVVVVTESTTNEPLENNVVEVSMNTDKKAGKALQITFSISGVESASLVSSDKDQLVVTGEGTNSGQLSISVCFKIDCAAMTTTDSGEIDTSGGTAAEGSQISSGGGGQTH